MNALTTPLMALSVLAIGAAAHLTGMAQVIGDPDGEVQVGTAGESTHAGALSVSNGGCASAAIAVSTFGGCSVGTVAALSVSGNASGAPIVVQRAALDEAVTVSVEGDASGGGIADISGGGAAGCGNGPAFVSASAGSDSCARSIAASGPGNATSGELAISATGAAYACGGPAPVAVSTGSATTCRAQSGIALGIHDPGINLSANGG